MFMDADLLFSDAQAVTAAAASTNYYDTGPLATGNARNLGVGEELYIAISVDTTFADTGSNSTLTVALETDDNTSFSSAAVVATLLTIPALAAAGTIYFVRMPIETTVPYERYLRIYYTPNNGDLSAGAVTAAIVKDISAYKSYVGGWSTGI